MEKDKKKVQFQNNQASQESQPDSYQSQDEENRELTNKSNSIVSDLSLDKIDSNFLFKLRSKTEGAITPSKVEDNERKTE